MLAFWVGLRQPSYPKSSLRPSTSARIWCAEVNDNVLGERTATMERNNFRHTPRHTSSSYDDLEHELVETADPGHRRSASEFYHDITANGSHNRTAKFHLWHVKVSKISYDNHMEVKLM